MFTDNSTAKAVANKGSSLSRKLHKLIVRLKYLQIKHGFDLCVTHLSGSRTIAQGTDGLFRGTVNVRGLNGLFLRKHVSLHQSALQRSSSLRE